MVSEARFQELQEQVKALTERVAKLENSAARAKDRVFVYYTFKDGRKMFLTSYDYMGERLSSYGFTSRPDEKQRPITRRDAERFIWDFEFENYDNERNAVIYGDEEVELKIMEATL